MSDTEIPDADLVNWGEYEGKKRLPCPEDPRKFKGQPLGMYHCPDCGMMVIAGMKHGTPHATVEEQEHLSYPLDHYEVEYEQPWPAGYEEIS